MTRAQGQIQLVRDTLAQMKDQFLAALPPQIPVDRFLRTVMTAVQMQPSLLDGDRRTLIGACMKAAQDGLLVDNREAALVMFGDTVQYMPMVSGILKKLRNSGELLDIAVHVAYANDEFAYELGDAERIVHRPTFGERGAPTFAYAIARTVNGGTYREVMSFEQVEAIRKRSRSGNRGPWITDWSEMARKTVIRRLAKRLPSSADLDSVLRHDDEAQGFVSIEPTGEAQDAPQQVAAPRMSRLKASIAKAAQGTQEAKEDSDGTEVPDAVRTG